MKPKITIHARFLTRAQPHYPKAVHRAPRTCALALAVLASLAAAIAASPPVRAADPTNKTECVGTLKPIIEARCHELFTDAQTRENCLGQVTTHVEQTCNQFFGDGQDFCAACTNSCLQSFPDGDPTRRECLSMCLQQPRCQ